MGLAFLSALCVLYVIVQIQVIEDDKVNRGGLFQTSTRGAVPPLVTTNIIAEDQGKFLELRFSGWYFFPENKCTNSRQKLKISLFVNEGNCNPRFMRSTMYNIPCTSDMLKQSYVPFALNICPFARLHPKEVS